MGHQITAIVTANPIDELKAREFDLPVFLEHGYRIIGLDVAHTDYWTEKLDFQYIDDDLDIPLDCETTHHFAEELGISKYAVIYTDYMGGIGDQFAAVYEHGCVVMATKSGGINHALHAIGVKCLPGMDEFDSLNLSKYRHFDRYFEKYWDNSLTG